MALKLWRKNSLILYNCKQNAIYYHALKYVVERVLHLPVNNLFNKIVQEEFKKIILARFHVTFFSNSILPPCEQNKWIAGTFTLHEVWAKHVCDLEIVTRWFYGISNLGNIRSMDSIPQIILLHNMCIFKVWKFKYWKFFKRCTHWKYYWFNDRWPQFKNHAMRKNRLYHSFKQLM